MADNTFDSEELDIQFQPITAYIDGDGSFKLNTPMLSSLDFDGSIPKVEDETLPVTDVMPGYFIKLEEYGDYFVVESVEVDEEFIDSTGLVTINYIDDQGQIISVDYDDTDTVHVMYEDWDEKILGTRGWGITSGGNAIFTNVAVRGRIEAEEGYISDTLTIGEFGSSTVSNLTTADDVQVFIDDLNNIISASISDIYLDMDSFSSSLVFLYNAGFVSSAQLITTGETQITGNNITTGIINANLVRVTSASSLVQNRGVQLSAVGLEGYNNLGQRTFFLNTDGTLEITGYATDNELQTASGILNTGLNNKISTGGAANDVNSNITTISGGKIRTGTVQSQNYSYTSGLYSNNGMQINLDGNGYIRTPKFYIDTAGNAYFSGDVSGATGTFTGPISSTSFPDRVVLQNGGLFIQAWNGSAYQGVGSLTGVFLSGGIPAIDLSGNLVLGQLYTTFNIIVGSGMAVLPEGSSNLRLMAGATTTPGDLVCQNVYDRTTAGFPVYVTTTGVIRRQSSSQKYKYNIVPLWNELSERIDTSKIADPLEYGAVDFRDVLKLAPSQFSKLEDAYAERDEETGEIVGEIPEYTLLGFIAEDVEDKFPIATIRGADGEPEAFDINAIVSGLLAVVAEQDEIIKSMKEDIDDLKSRMIQLESQLGG